MLAYSKKKIKRVKLKSEINQSVVVFNELHAVYPPIPPQSLHYLLLMVLFLNNHCAMLPGLEQNTALKCLQVLTRDSVTVSVDAVVYYRVSNATVSVANVENAHHSTRLLAQTTLRNILGTKNLHEILSDRESISGSMQVI